MLILHFDGLFRCAPKELNLGNDAGFMCYGWVILEDGFLVAQGHGGYTRCHLASSNVAEYLGLIEGIEALTDMHRNLEAVVVYGDAKSVIDQMEGRSAVTAPSIKSLHRRAIQLASHFRNISCFWTPRQNNHYADALTRKAFLQIRSDPTQWDATLQTFDLLKRKGQDSNRLRQVLDLRKYQMGAGI